MIKDIFLSILSAYKKSFWFVTVLVSLVLTISIVAILFYSPTVTNEPLPLGRILMVILNGLFFPLTLAMIFDLLLRMGINIKTFKGNLQTYQNSDMQATLYKQGYKRSGDTFYFANTQGPIPTTLNLGGKFHAIKKQWIIAAVILKLIAGYLIYFFSFLLGPVLFLSFVLRFKNINKASEE